MEKQKMKIDFSYKFTTLDGTIIPKGPDEIEEDKDGKKTTKKSPPLILKIVCVNVLLETGLDRIVCPQCKFLIGKPKELTGEEKMKRFTLATKLYAGAGPIDVEKEDIELLKNLIAENYPSPLIVGQAWSVLDPDEVEEKEKKK